MHDLAARVGRLSDALRLDVQLPPLPESILPWINEARPQVGALKRNFNLEPFWVDIYNDNHPQVMIVNGRQTFKTTYCSDKIAHYATTHPNCEVCYVADNESHLSAFSKQRLRRNTFKENPLLRQFLPHGQANVREISLLNNSIIYLRTDEAEYRHVEGLSNALLILDESQYHDLQFLSHATYSLTQTRGQLQVLGIGGEAGSEYHKMWEASDQRIWTYDNPNWREDLQFDSQGNIVNQPEELRGILSGHWEPTKPQNTEIHGYHMPQTIFARIPMSIEEAIHKYHVSARNSIEWQRLHNPPSIFSSHCLGEFFRAERRPITPEMVRNCMDEQFALLRPEEVRELKEVFGNEIRVLGGVDFGSGASGASSTVVSIIIHWRKSGRYQIAWIERRPQEHQLDQARYISELFTSYNIDFGVGDLGYGAIQVDAIQRGGRDSQDVKFNGVGKKRFTGCRTHGDETKPEQEFKQTTDEHGLEKGRIQIDKTTTIQNFIDLVGWYVSHPTRSDEEQLKRTKLLIPSRIDYETDFLIDDFTSITRKDLAENPEEIDVDPRQKARKEFNHPPDSVMAIVYCIVADNNYDAGAFSIRGVRKK